MGGLEGIVGGMIAGYLTAVVLHLALGWVITRESRGLLMHGECMSPLYFTQLGFVWALSGAAAVLVAMALSHLSEPEIAGAVTGLLLLVQLRNYSKQAPQQTLGVSLLMMLVTCVGSGVAWAATALRHHAS